MRRPVLAVLAAINGLLFVGLAALWVAPDGQLRNMHWTPPKPVMPDYEHMVPALPPLRAVPPDAFLASLERPLFSSTRRPPPPPPPPVAEAPPDLLGTMKVLGIYQADGVSGVIAMVDGKSRRIRVNEMFNGWQLRSVGERSVVFAAGGSVREISLVRAKMTGVVPPAPAPASAASAPASQPVVQFPPVVTADPSSPVTTPPSSEPGVAPRRPRFGP